MNNAPSHVVVRAAAPIPIGDEVEIHVVQRTGRKGVEAVVLRHIATSVMYGAAGAFDDRAVHDVLGDPELYLSPRLAVDWTVARTFHARVRECVVSNVKVDTGNGDWYIAAITSLLVEPSAAPQAYR